MSHYDAVLLLACSAAVLVGCDTSVRTNSAQKTTEVVSIPAAASVTVPPAPAIYAKGMTLQQGRESLKIGVPLALVEGQLVGDGDDPLWNYSDLLDSPKMAAAIDDALRSNQNEGVMRIGGERAHLFVVRLELLNASFSDLTNAGLLAPPILNVYSGGEFRTKVRYRELEICAGLAAYPGISRDYVNWIHKVADIVDQNQTADKEKRVP